MSEGESGRELARQQGHQKNKLPEGSLWPRCPCLLAQAASLGSSRLHGQEAEPG